MTKEKYIVKFNARPEATIEVHATTEVKALEQSLVKLKCLYPDTVCEISELPQIAGDIPSWDEDDI